MSHPEPDPRPEANAESHRTEDEYQRSAASGFREGVANHQLANQEDEEEQTLWSGGYSGKAMLGTWILMAIASVALLVGSAFVEGTWPYALGLILIIWVIGGVVYAARRFGVHYQLTTQRFIHQKGLLTRHTDRIEVIDIDDVTCSQGPIERIFGIGSIMISSSDSTHPELHMIGIADCRNVATLIDDTRRKERRRRSLHIEAI